MLFHPSIHPSGVEIFWYRNVLVPISLWVFRVGTESFDAEMYGAPGLGPKSFVTWLLQRFRVGLPLTTRLVSSQNLVLYVHCFDSLISKGPSGGPNNFYVYMNNIRT